MTKTDSQTVLVVDDEPEIRDLLVDALGDEDLLVRPAANGAEAISLANRYRPDFLVTDLLLGDCSGLDVIDHLRQSQPDLPTVVITGYASAENFHQASKHHPLELMTKPLDLSRLKRTIQDELIRRRRDEILKLRRIRLRLLARQLRLRRNEMDRHHRPAPPAVIANYPQCADHDDCNAILVQYQRQLLFARNDDDVFRTLFTTFVGKCGPVFGIASVCDADANLQVVGRFGVPYPDNPTFCHLLSGPVCEHVLTDPRCQVIDAYEYQPLFHPSIRKYLPGLSILAIPLVPREGEMIGVITLYRKGEQPFLETDLAMADLLSSPTAITVQRND